MLIQGDTPIIAKDHQMIEKIGHSEDAALYFRLNQVTDPVIGGHRGLVDFVEVQSPY